MTGLDYSVLHQDYIRTARSKGSESAIILTRVAQCSHPDSDGDGITDRRHSWVAL